MLSQVYKTVFKFVWYNDIYKYTSLCTPLAFSNFEYWGKKGGKKKSNLELQLGNLGTHFISPVSPADQIYSFQSKKSKQNGCLLTPIWNQIFLLNYIQIWFKLPGYSTKCVWSGQSRAKEQKVMRDLQRTIKICVGRILLQTINKPI